MNNPTIIVISLSELSDSIQAKACSGYACFDLGWSCNLAGYSQSGCDTYDSQKCDPLAPVAAVHGSFN